MVVLRETRFSDTTFWCTTRELLKEKTVKDDDTVRVEKDIIVFVKKSTS